MDKDSTVSDGLVGMPNVEITRINLIRLLGCGSRDLWVPGLVARAVQALASLNPIETIIEGGATGIDKCFQCASLSILGHQSTSFPISKSQWREQGSFAGGIRNQRMLDLGRPTHVMGLTIKPLDESTGTKDMLNRAAQAGLPLVYLCPAEPGQTLEEVVDLWIAEGCPFFMPAHSTEIPIEE